jgi:DoxX-like protein
MSATSSTPRRRNALLWTVQGLVAAVFLFAGGVKLTMPVAQLAQVSRLPGGFMKFIAVSELVGAAGLVLPGLLGIKRGLTPLAAACLLIIMLGATPLTVAYQGLAPATLPFVVGVLLVVIIRGRRAWASSRVPAVEDRDPGTGSATAGA